MFPNVIAFDSAMVEQRDQATGKNRRILSPKLGPQVTGKNRKGERGRGMADLGMLSGLVEQLLKNSRKSAWKGNPNTFYGDRG
jgi:hypothetical protein